MIELKNNTLEIVQLHTHEFGIEQKIEIDATWYVDSVVEKISIGDFSVYRENVELTSIVEQLAALRGDVSKVEVSNTIKQYPFADKKIENNSLFRRLHGKQFDLEIGENELIFSCPYSHAKITGVHIINSHMLEVAQFEVFDTEEGTYTGIPNFKLNQFGFSANMKDGSHEHVCKYDADLYQGMVIKITYESLYEKKLAINYYMDEVKD
jgi:hypothetical protein